DDHCDAAITGDGCPHNAGCAFVKGPQVLDDGLILADDFIHGDAEGVIPGTSHDGLFDGGAASADGKAVAQSGTGNQVAAMFNQSSTILATVLYGGCFDTFFHYAQRQNEMVCFHSHHQSFDDRQGHGQKNAGT